jgi:hypothetical protein
VHHHRVEADKFEQGDVPGKIGLQLLVHHGVAAVLHHHGHAGKLADIGQCLDEDVGNGRTWEADCLMSWVFLNWGAFEDVHGGQVPLP